MDNLVETILKGSKLLQDHTILQSYPLIWKSEFEKQCNVAITRIEMFWDFLSQIQRVKAEGI